MQREILPSFSLFSCKHEKATGILFYGSHLLVITCTNHISQQNFPHLVEYNVQLYSYIAHICMKMFTTQFVFRILVNSVHFY